MKKNLLFGIQSCVTTAALLLAVATNPLAAQETITLKQADYSIPTWTKLKTAAKVGTVDNRLPYNVNMTLNGDPTTRIAFAWFTNEGVANGEVQIVMKANAVESDFTAQSIRKITATIEAAQNLNYVNSNKNAEVIEATGIAANSKRSYTSHKVLADNLQPGTTYSYRVGSENGWSPIGSFTTAKSSKEPFSFIYLTDTQANTMDMFGVSQKTIHAAQRQVKDAQFLLVTGDLVESSGSTNSEWEWEQWFSNMQDVWYNLPIVPTQGNHDTSTNNNFAHHFNTDNSFNQTAAVGTAMNGTVYSFVYGDALFLMINYEDYAKEGYFKALTAWMEKQVAEHANVKWRIACYHKNMFTGSGSHQSDKDGKLVRENMLAVFDKLDIDLALQGHDHIYEVIGPVSNAAKTLVPGAVEHVETVTGNIRENMTGKQGGTFDVSNGTLYFLNNSAGKKKYEPRNESAMIAAIGDHAVNNYWGLFSGKFGQTGEPTFSDIKVSSDKIVISTYTVDGLGIPTLFDSFTLKKDKAVTSVMNVPEAEKVSIYPNPATEVINIGGVTADKVELFSTGGERVQQVSAGNQVNVSSLANGIYIVKVTAGQDTYFSKIVKK